ncbi:hypothetical protein KC19_3G002400 [Ceratodon purpureus]|uniref:Uncharacterized protein n=1 Tax=Ceratodon purpureus TaxID=3225 RepID=A0A8T0ID97_CERPU|nr:hypothetical protein KC19_3G002400 [Ceratodon purpureus]
MSADISGQNRSMKTLRLLSAWSLRIGCFSFSIFSKPLAVLSTGGLRFAVGLREASVDELSSFFLFFLSFPFPTSMGVYLVPEVAISPDFVHRISSSTQPQIRKFLFTGKSPGVSHLLDFDKSSNTGGIVTSLIQHMQAFPRNR